MASCHQFFFAVFSLFRFALNIGILERPLAVGLIWGACTGDFSTPVAVGVFFELFWLDQIPAGTYIPPNSVLSTFLCLSLCEYFKLSQPGEIVYPLVLTMPMAVLGAKLEYQQRRWQDGGYNSLLHWSRMPGHRRHPHKPERLVLFSLVQLVALNLALFTLGLLAILGILLLLGLDDKAAMLDLPLGWAHLWFLAAIGGLLALRVKRSYIIVACGVVLLALISIL